MECTLKAMETYRSNGLAVDALTSQQQRDPYVFVPSGTKSPHWDSRECDHTSQVPDRVGSESMAWVDIYYRMV